MAPQRVALVGLLLAAVARTASGGHRTLGVALAYVAATWMRPVWGNCSHETTGEVELPKPGDEGAPSANWQEIMEGTPLMHELVLSKMRLYKYVNTNVTTMNQPHRYRKLMISLEPCEGIVYLFVRKTRRCWPNPLSCCQPKAGSPGGNVTAPPCDPTVHNIKCKWTHFHSVLDGTRNAAPTFFEVPLSSTKYYITVYAPQDDNLDQGVDTASYRLTVLADIGAYPRPGLQGRLRVSQVGDLSVRLMWDQATYLPLGVSDGPTKYHVYSSLLLAGDDKENQAVFLSPAKVMNSVCGLEKNAVRYGVPLTSTSCGSGPGEPCNATIKGIVPRRRYMFNVVSESSRGFNSTYSGIIMSASFEEKEQILTDGVTAILGAICGTIFGVVVIGYLWIAKLYA